ncbi:hypothetical protein CK203_109243 [Vitis vinifera]|uniref:Uncharacterized protein n=1 Tax=Vitis vinifera TaxID=29760 RepID=A0A438C4B1_VITVI|nr:hypothetical protein CK203_109243 [Vitis vinifera]
MDSERAHHNNSSGSSTGELFICFTSRFSSSSSTSSSMKISSKSILSPGRTDKLREPQISLSSSLSRRLRSNGSMKGGQSSPMFPAAGKKRGCAFENPEPSSPKVTCIGQVRVKTKKQGKKMRSRSKRRGEVSFRKLDHTAEGGVVHQGHGHHLQTQQEFQLLPSVSLLVHIWGEREGGEGNWGEWLPAAGGASTSSCGAVFARWLVALQEGEKGREIELVVGEDERAMEGFQRRHVLDDIEIKLEEGEVKDEAVGGEEARVSICIPPKNALLLMRCRSDPMRMAALANRFWESPLPKEEEDDNEDEDEDQEDEYERNEHQQVDLYADAVEEQEGEEEEEGGDAQTKVELETAPQQLDEVLEKCVSVEKIEEENSTVSEEKATLVTEEEEEKQDYQGDTPERNPEIIELQEENQEKEEEEEAEEEAQGQEEEAEEMVSIVSIGSSPHPLVDSETLENEEIEPTQLLEDHEEQEEEDPTFPLDRRPSISSPPPPVPVHSEPESREDTAAEALAEEDEEEGATVEEKESEKSMVSEVEEEGTATHARPDPEQDQKAREPLKDEGGLKSNERETQPNLKGETTATTGAGAAVLPDCLLLMMCEPKLSMEVSKETWVNSADFIRWHPEKLVKPNNGQDQPKTRLSTDSNPTQQQLHQPPRSSCSFPAAAAAGASMATMIEQKFVNAAAYEPFVLTRCKSEPMRSSAKLASDACFWKNPKLEPHRPRVGAAGVGF